MVLGSPDHRITHQLRPINMNGRSILSEMSRLASFGRRRQPPDARNSLFYNILHHWDFGFVWTLFNPLGSTGQASGIPTLPVVPGLAAVADRAASRLPKSPLTMVSIRHTGSLVCAGDLVFHRIKRFFRAGDGAMHLCRSARGHPPSGAREMWMAPNAFAIWGPFRVQASVRAPESCAWSTRSEGGRQLARPQPRRKPDRVEVPSTYEHTSELQSGPRVDCRFQLAA